MQCAHQFGGLDVDRILILEALDLATEDEGEFLDMLGEVAQQKGQLFATVEINQLEGLEIADQDVARKLGLAQTVEIIMRLRLGPEQIAALGFLLNHQHAGPEQINEPGRTADLFDRVFVVADLFAVHPEDVEKLIVKLWVSPFSYRASCHRSANCAARARISCQLNLMVAL